MGSDLEGNWAVINRDVCMFNYHWPDLLVPAASYAEHTERMSRYPYMLWRDETNYILVDVAANEPRFWCTCRGYVFDFKSYYYAGIVHKFLAVEIDNSYHASFYWVDDGQPRSSRLVRVDRALAWLDEIPEEGGDDESDAQG